MSPEQARQLLAEANQAKSRALKGFGGFALDGLSKQGREDIVNCSNTAAFDEKSGRNTRGSISSEPMEALFKLLDGVMAWLKAKRRTEDYSKPGELGKGVGVPEKTVSKKIDTKS